MTKTHLREFSSMTKRVVSVVIAAMVLAIGPVSAQSSGGQRQVPMGYCYSTSLASASKLTSFTCNMADGDTIANEVAFIQSAAVCIYTAGVVWRDDGVAPTAAAPSGGEGVSAGTCFPYNGTFSEIQFIQQGAGAAVGMMLYR